MGYNYIHWYLISHLKSEHIWHIPIEPNSHQRLHQQIKCTAFSQPKCMSHTNRDNFNSSAFSFCKPSCPRIRQWQISPPWDCWRKPFWDVKWFQHGATFYEYMAPKYLYYGELFPVSSTLDQYCNMTDLDFCSDECSLECSLGRWYMGSKPCWSQDSSEPIVMLCSVTQWCAKQCPTSHCRSRRVWLSHPTKEDTNQLESQTRMKQPSNSLTQHIPIYWRSSHLCWTYFRQGARKLINRSQDVKK